MRYLRTQGGFTLVELVIVLALSALLFAGVLAGQGSIQSQTAFTSAIDAARLQLKGIQNEANQSVSAPTDTAGGNSAYTTFGRLVELDNTTPATSSTMKTWTLIEDAAKANLYKCNEQDLTLPDQVNFMQATNSGGPTTGQEAIIFGRDPNQTYLDPNFVDSQAGDVAACHPSVAAAPVTPTVPALCAGFTRTQSDPSGTCPLPPPPPPPPLPCNNNPGWQCGLYGQYYTGIISDASRTEDSAYIDQGIGADAIAVHSYPSFSPALANRTISPPASVSVKWSGQILIGAADFPSLTTHTYCFRDSTIGDMTIDGIASTGSATNPCVTVNPSDLASGAGWYPIQIDYQTNRFGTRPSAQLYEQDASTGGLIIEVPGGSGGDLEAPAGAVLMAPSNAFANGLYGQYYGDAFFTRRVSTYTDPLIGDGGTKFSFDSASPSTDVFSSKLEWNTAKSNTASESATWTGQILVDTAGPQTYCIAGANGTVTLKIDGTRILTSSALGTTPTCATTASLTAGWHNLEYDYATTGNGPLRSLRLEQELGSVTQDVPNSHLRRPLDWTATGSQGSCKSGDTDCQISGSDIQENSSSNGSCSSSDQRGVMNFTKTGLTPDSTYNMDLSYFNAPDSQDLPVPDGYSFEVCVSVNGTLVSGGGPAELPISEPSINPRTYTFSGITVPASGDITVSLNWLNDAYSSGFSSGYNDANFAVSRLDLYRTLNASGVLSAAPPRPTTSVATAASRPTVAAASLAARLFSLVAPTAQAASACDTNVLNPANYTVGCFASLPSASLHLEVPGYVQNGYLDISTQDGSIERRIQ